MCYFQSTRTFLYEKMVRPSTRRTPIQKFLTQNNVISFIILYSSGSFTDRKPLDQIFLYLLSITDRYIVNV